jgi:hypothetical protein
MPLFFRSSLLLLAACALAPAAFAQGQQSPAIACPAAKSLKAPQLYGLWSARFSSPPRGLPAEATLLLEKHAEFSESLAGMVSRQLGADAPSGMAARALLAGDIDEGVLVLDESSDNVSITGAWNAEVVEGSCGQQIKGVWKDLSRGAAPDAPDVSFTLTKRQG